MSEPDPRAVVASYLGATGRHDVDAALRHLSDDFELQFVGGPSIGADGLRSALEWDRGVDGRLEWDWVAAAVTEVVVEGRETSAFFQLLGVEPLPFRSRFLVSEEGLISRQRHEVHAPGAGYEEALARAVAWAEQHEPGELARIYPEGRLVYSEAMGRRWVALLRRWRGA